MCHVATLTHPSILNGQSFQRQPAAPPRIGRPRRSSRTTTPPRPRPCSEISSTSSAPPGTPTATTPWCMASRPSAGGSLGGTCTSIRSQAWSYPIATKVCSPSYVCWAYVSGALNAVFISFLVVRWTLSKMFQRELFLFEYRETSEEPNHLKIYCKSVNECFRQQSMS